MLGTCSNACCKEGFSFRSAVRTVCADLMLSVCYKTVPEDSESGPSWNGVVGILVPTASITLLTRKCLLK